MPADTGAAVKDEDGDSEYAQDMSDRVLQNYKLGEKLGQGSFGCVYRALNWLTGETCAVKQVTLHNIRKQDLPEIMSEIDLLKKLDHPNIVQYRGFVRTPDCLYIILEYCENGSLQSITKKFGHFPESLVALYILQVLQGLVYLHDQGVIHRDIKASNILATKEGTIKLADFGVATVTDGPLDSRIVGSPYWMAPEVVEQTGATTASDVWSVGALVIELITGRPPYYFLDPMPALFRIVNDDCPPLPDRASAAARDFLAQCFQKDANLRVSARKLLRHPWIMAAKKQADDLKLEQQNKLLTRPVASATSTTPVKRQPAVVDRQQLRRKQSKDLITALQPRSINTVDSSTRTAAAAFIDTRNRPDSAVATKHGHPATAAMPSTPRSERRRSLIQASPTSLARSSSLASLSELGAGGGGRRKSLSGSSGNSDSDSDGTIKASKPRHRLEIPVSMSPITEDYSDLVAEDEADPFKGKLRDLQSKQAKRRSLIVERQPPRSVGLPSSSSLQDIFGSNAVQSPSTKPPPPRPARLELEPNTFKRLPTRSQSLQSFSMQSLPETPKTPSAAQARFGETVGEDYSDVLGTTGINNKDDSLRLSKRISSGSWLGGAQENEDDDPFANMDEGSFGSNGSAKERAETARMTGHLTRLVESLRADAEADEIQDAAVELVTMLEESPRTHDQFIRGHGLLALVEVLQAVRNADVLGVLLRIVNVIVGASPEALERFCLIGGCPVVMAFASGKHTREIRLEAALFIGSMCRTSALTLQIFVSCRGLDALVELMDENYAARKDLVWMSVDGISRVFEMQGPTPRSDLCRIFVRNGLLEPLSSSLISVVSDQDDLAESAKAKIVGILHLFSQADAKIKEQMATRLVVLRLVKVLPSLEGEWLVLMVKTIKNLSTVAVGLEVLQNAGAIELLVDLLKRSQVGDVTSDIQSHVVNTLFNLCRLSKVRLEEAASAGAIEPLQELVKVNSPLKQFALPVLCDFAHAGKVCRRLLWKHRGLELYLDLLRDNFWAKAALEALLAWLIDETAEVERRLSTAKAIECLLRGFCLASSASFEGIIEPFYRLLRLSDTIAASLACHQPFLVRLAERLQRAGRAVVRLNLLRTVKTVLEAGISPQIRSNVTRELSFVVDSIAQNDPALLVRELAREVKSDFAYFQSRPTLITTSQARSTTMIEDVRRRSSLRRTTSESAVVLLAPAQNAATSSHRAPESVQRRQSLLLGNRATSDPAKHAGRTLEAVHHRQSQQSQQQHQQAQLPRSRTGLRGVLPFLS
ncbi:hypothetical protein ACM66B_003127 [Microbotryomycetes sp. NB124-2]